MRQLNILSPVIRQKEICMEKIGDLTQEQFDKFKFEKSKKRVRFIKELLGFDKETKIRTVRAHVGDSEGLFFNPQPLEVYEHLSSENKIDYFVIIEPLKLVGNIKMAKCFSVSSKCYV